MLLNSSDLTKLSGFFGHDLGFKLVFGFGPGWGLKSSARLQLCCERKATRQRQPTIIKLLCLRFYAKFHRIENYFCLQYIDFRKHYYNQKKQLYGRKRIMIHIITDCVE